MGRVRCGMAISLDGFVNDRNGKVGGLYPDLAALDATEMLQEEIRNTGAAVMGRHTYDMAQGDFTGYEFQVPIFVVTHHVPEKVARGENERLKFKFVTNGIARAIEQARAAAGDKDVTVVGGANLIQQCLEQGLVDEVQVGIMPVLLGRGLRLFEQMDDREIKLEKTRVIESPAGRTDIVFRVVKEDDGRR